MIKSVNFILWEVYNLFERKLVCLTRPLNCKIYIATMLVCRFFLFCLYFSENVIFYLACRREFQAWAFYKNTYCFSGGKVGYFGGRSSFPSQLPESSSPTTELPFMNLALGSPSLRGSSE